MYEKLVQEEIATNAATVLESCISYVMRNNPNYVHVDSNLIVDSNSGESSGSSVDEHSYSNSNDSNINSNSNSNSNDNNSSNSAKLVIDVPTNYESAVSQETVSAVMADAVSSILKSMSKDEGAEGIVKEVNNETATNKESETCGSPNMDKNSKKELLGGNVN